NSDNIICTMYDAQKMQKANAQSMSAGYSSQNKLLSNELPRVESTSSAQAMDMQPQFAHQQQLQPQQPLLYEMQATTQHIGSTIYNDQPHHVQSSSSQSANFGAMQPQQQQQQQQLRSSYVIEQKQLAYLGGNFDEHKTVTNITTATSSYHLPFA